jgi:hypothetical protein
MGTDLRRQTLRFTDNHLLRGLSVLVVLNLHLMRVLNPLEHTYPMSCMKKFNDRKNRSIY